MGIDKKKITRKQEAMITVTILVVTSAIIIVMSNNQFQEEIRKESLAANGIEPENAAPAARPTTNIEENTASTNQTFWVNTSTS